MSRRRPTPSTRADDHSPLRVRHLRARPGNTLRIRPAPEGEDDEAREIFTRIGAIPFLARLDGRSPPKARPADPLGASGNQRHP